MSRFLESYNKDEIGLLGKKYKHLSGQHDQKTHGSWANGRKIGESSRNYSGKPIKLIGSVPVPSIDEVVKAKAIELGTSENVVRKMIEDGVYKPEELDKEYILKNVVNDRFSGISHKIASMDDPDLIVVAEVIKNLPDTVSPAVQLQLNDKDLTTGPSKFGSSGSYEPPAIAGTGYVELNIQSDNPPDRKAWVTAHEYGHSASLRTRDYKSLVLKKPELLTLLGFGDKDTYPQGFVSGKDNFGREFTTHIVKDGYYPVKNTLNHYMNNQGPFYYVIRKDITPWTRYGYAHPEEAFAEAFAGYMVSPRALKRDRPMLYNWMKENVFEGLEYEGYSEEPPKIDPWS